MSKAVEPNIWGIHAGKTGDADSQFLKKHCIALGWTKLGNLAAIPADREALKPLIAQAYPEKKPGAIPVDAGILFRFVHEMKQGDLVAYPSKLDRQIHLGRVEGDYRHEPKTEDGYPNIRPVKWLKAVAKRTQSREPGQSVSSAGADSGPDRAAFTRCRRCRV